MWIALGVVGFLAILITVILLLPVKVIIKNNEKNELLLRYKFLGKLYGEDPDPNDPIVKMLKTATGASRLEKAAVKQSVQTDGLKKTVTESYAMLVDLLKQLLELVKRGTVTKLQLRIICAGDGADQAAIHYGQCSAATYSLLHAVKNIMKIRRRACDIDIRCDFERPKGAFRYDTVIRLRAGRVLAAFWKVALAEARRDADQPKNSTN